MNEKVLLDNYYVLLVYEKSVACSYVVGSNYIIASVYFKGKRSLPDPIQNSLRIHPVIFASMNCEVEEIMHEPAESVSPQELHISA